MRMIIVYLLIVLVSVCKAQTEAGQKVFEKNCRKCHGSNGKRGLFGAKDLTKSTLTIDQARKIISNGKQVMPAWKEKLDAAEIDRVIEFILTLRQ